MEPRPLVRAEPPPERREAAEPAGSGRRRRLPLLLPAAGLALLCGAVYGGWEVYRALLAPPASSGLPLFAADPSPYKLVPDDPGGDSIPNTDVIVLEDTVSGESRVEYERLMPEPEEPLTLGPEAETAPAEDDVIDVETSDVAEVVVDVDAGPIFSAADVSAYMDEIMAEAGGGMFSGPPLPAVKPEPPAPAETATLYGDETAVAPGPGDDGAGLSFDDVAAAISGGSAGTGEAAPIEGGETSASAGPSPSGDGLVRVQVASYSTRDAATAAWNRLYANHIDLLGRVEEPLVLETVLGAATFYRLQVGAYRNRADAEALCSGLKRRNVDCLVVGP